MEKHLDFTLVCFYKKKTNQSHRSCQIYICTVMMGNMVYIYVFVSVKIVKCSQIYLTSSKLGVGFFFLLPLIFRFFVLKQSMMCADE
jgi:hypothetical protein